MIFIVGKYVYLNIFHMYMDLCDYFGASMLSLYIVYSLLLHMHMYMVHLVMCAKGLVPGIY